VYVEITGYTIKV